MCATRGSTDSGEIASCSLLTASWRVYLDAGKMEVGGVAHGILVRVIQGRLQMRLNLMRVSTSEGDEFQ